MVGDGVKPGQEGLGAGPVFSDGAPRPQKCLLGEVLGICHVSHSVEHVAVYLTQVQVVQAREGIPIASDGAVNERALLRGLDQLHLSIDQV
jgi:hypothetical protein